MSPGRAWSVLAILLLVTSVGVSSILNIILILILTIIASIIVFFVTLFAYTKVDKTPLCSRIAPRPPALQRRTSFVKKSRSVSPSMTGCEAMDKPLQDMISYILRDYVTSWYEKISSNPAFTDELRIILYNVVTLLTERIYVVDWVAYLTQDFVDDIATHVRLFKNARNKHNSPIRDGEARPADLETIFFNYEAEMEGDTCRDDVCLNMEGESLYFQELCELLLYLVLPKHEFQSGPVRCLTREILSCAVFQPSFVKLSDPDFINQTLVWLYTEYDITSDVFIHTLRHTENMAELEATRDLVNKEITRLRSCDAVPDEEDSKLQLNSLVYLKKVIDTKISRLQAGFSGNSYGIPANIDWSGKINPNTKLFNLPLEVLLKNNIALSYFIDYMTSISSQHIIFFYLNIEGWKVSAEQQIQAMEVEFLKTGSNEKFGGYLETMREAALSIYQEYLSDKAMPRIEIEDSLNKKLLLRIRSDPDPDPTWFDEVAASTHQQLEKTEKYLKDFKRSVGYLKLLAELDLLKGELEDDEDMSIEAESMSLNSLDQAKSEASSGSDSHGECVASWSGDLEPSSSSPRRGSGHSRNASLGSLGKGDLTEFTAEIVDIHLARENGTGKQFVNYVILVKRNDAKWQILRRYSDFFYFYQTVTGQYLELSKIPFPGKKTFGNLERNVFEKRRKMLSEYLSELLRQDSGMYPGLYEMIFTFLSPGWQCGKSNAVVQAVTAVSQDIKRSVKTVSSAVNAVPDKIVKNFDIIIDGLSGGISHKDIQDDMVTNSKVGAGLEHDDNIPLRITLRLLDEVFDLADRNIWLRRQMIIVLRQIVKTMFGDTVNKKIVDYFRSLTSVEAVSGYLNNIKDNLWPGGFPPAPSPARDEPTQMRTRVAARASLFSSLSDELRRVIGSETSRLGLHMLFDMLQYHALNKRLVIVILEGIIITLFPEHKFKNIFKKLHSNSSRIRNDLRLSQRTTADLRRI